MKRRALTAAALCAAAAAITLIGGAVRGSASTTSKCTPPESSREFCVTVTDTDGVSVSGTSIPGTNEKTVSYLAYTITVQNNGASLTNGVTTVQLKDDGSVSTAAFQSSLSTGFCKLTSKPDNIVTCSHGNLAGNTSVTFTLVYISSTTVGTTVTNAHVFTAFKEKLLGEPKGANIASVPVDESTNYLSGDSAGSWSPAGQQVRLATDSADNTGQWSVLKFSNPLLHSPFLASLVETTVGTTVNCAPGLSCVGQNVHLVLDDAISADNLGYVQINMINPGPGINALTVNISHKLDNGDFELITARCTSEPPTDVPPQGCLTATDMRMPGGIQLLRINVWLKHNGDVRGY